MGLTRIRAEQISDIDYKQAVRVIALSNITLSGGAPNVVDGVTLSVNNRVLVAGQNTGAQNGLYYVSTLGTGSNGTWTRTTDGNETGEIQAGMIVMVTEGDSYKDTQWKLTTNDPIVIGVTTLTFEQNSAYAFGNIYANGTAVLANAVGGTVTLTAGNNIAITGNNTSKTITFEVTGISLNSISNGTSNVNVVSSGGNVTVGVAGTGNIAVFNTGGVEIKGNIALANANANISTTTDVASWYYENSVSVAAEDTEPRGIFFRDNGTRMYVVGNAGDDVGQYNVSVAWDVSTATFANAYVVSAQGTTPYDVSFNTAGNVMYMLDGGNDTVFQYTLGTAWDVSTASYASLSFSVASQEATPTGMWWRPDGTKMYIVGTTGDDVNEYNITAGNVATASFVQVFSFSTYETAPEGIAFSSDGTKMWIVGATYNRITEFALGTAWNVSTASFVNQVPIATSGPYFLLGASGLFVDTGNGVAYVSDYQNDRIFQYATDLPNGRLRGPQWTVDNDLNIGNNFAASGNFWVGGSTARFVGAVTAVSSMSSPNFATTSSTGTTSLITGTTTGTINFGTGLTTGTLNTMTAQTTGSYVLGGTSGTGAINIGRSTANQSIVLGNGITGSGNTKTIDIGTLGASGSNTNITIGSSTSGATTATLIYGNANIGNITTTGTISATGNIQGGNLLTGGLISATSTITSAANITGGNLLTGGLISATSTITSAANVIGGNLTTAGLITATGNIQGGNLRTAGLVSATGTITSAANVIGGNLTTAGLITATGNVTGGNILTGGLISTVGNVLVGAGNAGYVFGNAFFMTGISSAISVTKIENGTSNVWVRDPGGDVTVTAGGISNVAVFSTGSLAVLGAIGNPKTMQGNVVIANGINATMVGPIEWGTYNLTVPDDSTVYIIPG